MNLKKYNRIARGICHSIHKCICTSEIPVRFMDVSLSKEHAEEIVKRMKNRKFPCMHLTNDIMAIDNTDKDWHDITVNDLNDAGKFDDNLSRFEVWYRSIDISEMILVLMTIHNISESVTFKFECHHDTLKVSYTNKSEVL